MSKKARLTEKLMQAIERVRGKGYSWNDVQKYMKNFYKINHNATTYMRHYRKWKAEQLNVTDTTTKFITDTTDDVPDTTRQTLWERIKSFFGA